MSQHGGFIRKRVVPVFIHEHYRFTSEFYFLKILYGILHYMLIKRSQSDETIPCHSSFCPLERGSCTGTWSSSSLRAMRNTPPGTTWLSLDHSVTLWSALFTRSNLIGSRGFVLFLRTTSVDDHYAFFVLFKAVLADLQILHYKSQSRLCGLFSLQSSRRPSSREDPERLRPPDWIGSGQTAEVRSPEVTLQKWLNFNWR